MKTLYTIQLSGLHSCSSYRAAQ